MVDTQTIIAFISVSSGLILFGVTTFYTDFYNQPSVHIVIAPSDADGRNATIVLTNDGRKAATNILLTIKPPKDLANYTINTNSEGITPSPHYHNRASIVFHIPRLTNGDGSVVTINTLINTKRNTHLTNYTGYATYDQGSTMAVLNSSSAGFLSVISGVSPQLLVSVAFAVLIYSIVRYRLRNKIREDKFTHNLKNMIDARTNLENSTLTYDRPLPEIENPPEFIFYPDDYNLIEKYNGTVGERNSFIAQGNLDLAELAKYNKDCLEAVREALQKVEWAKYKDSIRKY